MEIFIQMMRHHLKYIGFKFHSNRLNRLDTRKNLKQSDRAPLIELKALSMPMGYIAFFKKKIVGKKIFWVDKDDHFESNYARSATCAQH